MRICTVSLAVLLAAARAAANPADAYGYGARAPAMAGAATAATDGDSSATYYNPAALATADEIRIDLGYQAAKPSLAINGGDQGVDAARGIVVGAVIPGRIGPVKLALGVGVHLPDERVLRLRTIPASQPRWVYYDNRPQRFFLSAGVAVALTDDLWIGGGISYMSRTQGTLDLSGRLGYPASDESDLQQSIAVDLVAVRYPNAGVLWRATPWLELGVTYRGSFVLSVDQGFTVHADIGAATQPIVKAAFLSLSSISLDHFQPLELSAGFAARLHRRLLVAGDLTYARWSAFENPAAIITLAYDFKDLNQFVNFAPPAPLPPALFHDIVIPRIGVEVTATRHILLRAGYSFEPSPAPEQRDTTNFVDNDKHTLAAGLGIRVFGLGAIIPRPLDIDLFAAVTVLPERDHRKLSPVDPVGDYVSGGHIVSGGLETRWRF